MNKKNLDRGIKQLERAMDKRENDLFDFIRSEKNKKIMIEKGTQLEFLF